VSRASQEPRPGRVVIVRIPETLVAAERDLIHERTMDGLAAAAVQGRYGGRPAAVDDDTVAIARARRARGESATSIAAHLELGARTWQSPARRLRGREAPPVQRATGRTRFS
jgi:DNA invertase Pin-like site-specific DNA recombinase